MKKVLPLMMILVLVAVLAGCGPTTGGEQELADELHVYNWSEYIDPEIYEEFENEFGVKVVEDTFSSNEDLLAKLQAGASGYDVIVPSDYMVAIMIELDLLAELNYDNIPNFSNVSDTFKDPPYDPGNTYSVPYQWGTTGIGYNADEFDEPPGSWAYLFDPEMAAPYAGRMSMLNDPRETIGAALKYLGYSVNSTDEAQLEEAKQLLIQQKEWVSTYDSDGFEDLLAAGETLLGHGWSGDFFAAAEEAEQVWYIIPDEGGVIWTDNLAVPKTAPSQYTAEVFINYLLRPEVGAKITNYTWYGSPNQASEEFIDAEILEEPAIYPPPEVMDKLEFLRDVGEATTLYDRIWTEIKTE
ncbi:MAG: spermidine/putrescine ABC transporter substrate-binding protein [Anaerolineae bacterium]|jgi:spermidine/putrescine-binding protein